MVHHIKILQRLFLHDQMLMGPVIKSTNNVRKSSNLWNFVAMRHNHATKFNVAASTEKPLMDEPEPNYARDNTIMEQVVIHIPEPFSCHYGGTIPNLNIAYESWGELNKEKNNVILIQHGLSANPHAKCHNKNTSSKGWWENFIGPDLALDTNKFHVICVNLLGSCYGTTGPSTINTLTGKPFGGDFPIVSISDMIRVQFKLLDLLGVKKVHSVVGASLGGLASFMSGALFSERIDRLVSISSGGNSGPSAIAFRYLQREALMNDPNWNGGHYYDQDFPIDGANLARKIATLTYRSGPEWNQRFKSDKVKHDVQLPRFDGPEFLIEDYIRHQGESFIPKTKFDPNSLIYLSKAMDIFDMSEGCSSMEEGFSRITCPTLVMGASSDILYPVEQQKQAAQWLTATGNNDVILYVSDGYYGHDTFLLDVDGMGSKMKEFLEC